MLFARHQPSPPRISWYRHGQKLGLPRTRQEVPQKRPVSAKDLFKIRPCTPQRIRVGPFGPCLSRPPPMGPIAVKFNGRLSSQCQIDVKASQQEDGTPHGRTQHECQCNEHFFVAKGQHGLETMVRAVSQFFLEVQLFAKGG